MLDVVGAAIGRSPFAVVIEIGLKAELGGNDDVFAEGSKSIADDFFVDVRAIEFGGVEEGDAALYGGADKLDGFGLFRGGAEAEAEAHAAEAECRNFEAAFPSVRFCIILLDRSYTIRTYIQV